MYRLKISRDSAVVAPRHLDKVRVLQTFSASTNFISGKRTASWYFSVIVCYVPMRAFHKLRHHFFESPGRVFWHNLPVIRYLSGQQILNDTFAFAVNGVPSVEAETKCRTLLVCRFLHLALAMPVIAHQCSSSTNIEFSNFSYQQVRMH